MDKLQNFRRSCPINLSLDDARRRRLSPLHPHCCCRRAGLRLLRLSRPYTDGGDGGGLFFSACSSSPRVRCGSGLLLRGGPRLCRGNRPRCRLCHCASDLPLGSVPRCQRRGREKALGRSKSFSVVRPEPDIHRVGPESASLPSSLTENPHSSLSVGPKFGPSLSGARHVMLALAGGR